MSEARTHEAKGRIKEASRKLTGDDGLEREGKVDRASGSAKEKISDVTERVRRMVERR